VIFSLFLSLSCITFSKWVSVFLPCVYAESLNDYMTLQNWSSGMLNMDLEMASQGLYTLPL
jgi:hypothetical protein